MGHASRSAGLCAGQQAIPGPHPHAIRGAAGADGAGTCARAHKSSCVRAGGQAGIGAPHACTGRRNAHLHAHTHVMPATHAAAAAAAATAAMERCCAQNSVSRNKCRRLCPHALQTHCAAMSSSRGSCCSRRPLYSLSAAGALLKAVLPACLCDHV